MPSFLITCCHATCTVPEAFRELFKGSEDLVTSVAGWEPGALNLAQGLAMKFSTPLIHGDVTRLLLDLDHDNEKRWSKISTTLPEATKVKLIERHEKKFRMAIEQRLMEDFKRHTSVIHLIIHTAPIADGSIILEYSSSDHARIIAEATVNNLPASEITSRSSPLLEKTPLIRWLLENFDSGKYGLIRITVSQSFFLKSIPMRWETIKRSLIQAIEKSSIPHPA